MPRLGVPGVLRHINRQTRLPRAVVFVVPPDLVALFAQVHLAHGAGVVAARDTHAAGHSARAACAGAASLHWHEGGRPRSLGHSGTCSALAIGQQGLSVAALAVRVDIVDVVARMVLRRVVCGVGGSSGSGGPGQEAARSCRVKTWAGEGTFGAQLVGGGGRFALNSRRTRPGSQCGASDVDLRALAVERVRSSSFRRAVPCLMSASPSVVWNQVVNPTWACSRLSAFSSASERNAQNAMRTLWCPTVERSQWNSCLWYRFLHLRQEDGRAGG